jgi:ribose 5-phosphate isomerase B
LYLEKGAPSVRIAVGSDHRGFQLKDKLRAMLQSKGHEVFDVGTQGSESVDYPDFSCIVAEKVRDQDVERGILICGTGIGMAITANKFRGVRAAPCADEVSAELSRRHNNANVLCLSGDMLSVRAAERIVEMWITTDFEGGRHSRRIQKIEEIEKQQSCDLGE